MIIKGRVIMNKIVKNGVILTAVLMTLTSCTADEGQAVAESMDSSEITTITESVSESIVIDTNSIESLSGGVGTDRDDMSGQGADEPDMMLYRKGLELVQGLDTMAESKKYIEMFSTSDELVELIDKIGAQDYSVPRAVFKITDLSFASIDISEFEEPLKTKLDNRMLTAVPSQINALQGASFIAAASIVSDSYSFICRGVEKPCFYLYQYEGDYCAGVSFIPNDENIVSAAGSFIYNEDLASADSAEAVKEALLYNHNVGDCTVEKVS